MFDSDIMAVLSLVLAIVALVQTRNLKREIVTLQRRLVAPVPAALPPTEPAPVDTPETIRPDETPTAAAPAPMPAEPRPEDAPPPPPAPPPAAPPPPPPPPDEVARPWRAGGQGLEERLGGRWSVWVGGIALALGGLFLVRASIEQGLIGPGARVGLGALFALAMMAAGEALRRRERRSARPGFAAAHIPSVLTAVGTLGAFGTVFAAHALYGFIGPTTAFVLLGLIGLGTMVASALHGPALAGLGLLGAFVAPLLVASNDPAPWPLVAYLLITSASAQGLARLRRWAWLALAAVGGAALWAFLLWLLARQGDTVPAEIHLLVQTIAAAALVGGFDLRRAVDPIGNPALGVMAATSVAYLALLTGPQTTFCLAEAAVLLAAAVWRPQMAPAALAAALLPIAALLLWPVDPAAPDLLLGSTSLSLAALDPDPFAHLLMGTVPAMALGGPALLRVHGIGPRSRTAWIAAAGVACPIVALVIGYARLGGFVTSPGFAVAAGALAAGLVAVLLWLERAPWAAAGDAGGRSLAMESYAGGAVGALTLGLAVLLAQAWLTVSLALAALGVAYVTTRRDYGALRAWVAALAVIVLARLAWEPRLVGPDLGTTPLLNALLPGYGGPALCFFLAGWLLDGRRPGDPVARLCRAVSVLLLWLLIALELRHLLNGGDIAASCGLAEAGLQVTVGFGLSRALLALDLRRGDPVYHWASLVGGSLALAAAVAVLGIGLDPIFTGEPLLGGVVINDALAAYGLPALGAASLARASRGARPVAFVIAAGSVSVLLFVLLVTIDIRHAFHPDDMSVSMPVEAAESWAYSAAWLALGVLLLAYGLLARAVAARAASAVLILCAVAKIFLIDMSGTSGLWRALSFLMLGAILIGIGMLYQRLRPPPAAPS